MARIIAGQAGGQVLAPVPGNNARPTTDRTKESLFSWLESRGWTDQTRVLDLFAGSGALGLEAASRGAAEVLLVDQHRKTAAVAKKNTAAVNKRLGAQVASVRVSNVDAALDAVQSGSWDLVLADPPYPLEEEPLHATLQKISRALDDKGLVVLERSARSDEPRWPEGLELLETRKYGGSQLYFAVRPSA